MSKVSIITPLFNKECYIAETIQSVLSQSIENWEMLIIDNLSTDNSFAIAQQFNDPRIKFFQCHKQGPGATRNLGISQAKGQWIQFLDGDDLLEEDHLESQLAIAENHPSSDIIVSCWQEFTDSNPQQRVLKKPTGINQSIQDLKDSAIAYTPWAPHTAFVRRNILYDPYIWPEELDQFLAEDTAFWFRIINTFSVTYSHRSGALYRVGVPESRTNPDPQKWFEGNHQVVKNNLTFLTKQSIAITCGQIKYLIKLYSGLYSYAQNKKCFLVKEYCKNEVVFWLNSYFDIATYPEISMILIKLFGLDFYINLVRSRLRLTF